MERNIKDYAKEVASHVMDYLPDGYEGGKVEELRKGRMILTGIAIKRQDSRESFAKPVNFYYAANLDPRDAAERVVRDICKEWEENEKRQEKIKLVVHDFSKCRDKIFIRIFGTNDGLPVPTPNRSIAPGLAAVCYIDVYYVCEEDACVVVNVTDEILDLWNTSFDEVYSSAVENMKKAYYCKRMREAIRDNVEAMSRSLGLVKEKREILIQNAMEDFKDIPIYVLKAGVFGAGAIAVPEILRRVSDEIPEGDTFYIIPSSTKEVLITPIWLSGSTEDMNSMIEDTNRDSVDPTEQLSDKLYLYKGGRLTLA